MSQVKFTETILRDAHQSLIATRMSTAQMQPALEMLDQVGYYALEMWGGATFDSSLRFLKEDPWERLRIIRKHVKNTKLQMLLRGQNILGYKHYPDDVLDEFIFRSVDNGIDIIRTFDALNDFRNIERSIQKTKEAGAHAQGALCYTTSPVHTTEKFVQMAKELEQMGSDSICIKDMSGLLLPYDGAELVRAIKAEVDLPVELHSHMSNGLADMMYLKGIEEGAQIVDTALMAFANGTSQPPTEALAMALKGTEYDPQLDMDVLMQLADYFNPIRDQFLADGTLNPKVYTMDIKALYYQVPGGMYSNLVSQMTLTNQLDLLPKVLAEIPKVREELGYPPLVTPTSQLVGAQAVTNVVSGGRYTMVPKEIREYVRGMYGRPPAAISEDIKQLILSGKEPITERPAEHLEPQLEKLKAELGDLVKQPEDVLSYALFPNVAREYFKHRDAQ
ncbi:MAG: oxaloacetate decarboxylase subunit alpha [Tissierellia bacterium]|nr:oxaloacetate decarboxylase subunit alpha [Tissierellia bacterium]